MRRYSVIVLLALLSVSLWAAVVTPEEAQSRAADYLTRQAALSGRRAPARQSLQLTTVRHKMHSDEPAYYVYQTNEDGFVLMSADDRVRPVLGHSYEGVYDEDVMPDNMKMWLDYLTERISLLPASAQRAPQASYPNVSPLLEKEGIHWGQDEPFNRLCPTVDGEKCPSGCVATATAQIMRYWKYPSKGRGSYSYEWNNTTLKTNFGAHTYDWPQMKADYNNGYSTAQGDAVALLMYDVGVGCNMYYAPGGSGSNEYFAAYSLVSYFDYDSTLTMVSMDAVGVSRFEKTLVEDLQAQRPIMLVGASDSGSGHAFVCDGVNSEGLFHINWGWDGWYNGDFVITAMYPDGQGTGGALNGEGYTHEVAAVVGIQPNQGGAPIPAITVEKMTILEDKSSYQRNEAFTVKMTTFLNNGIFTWSGYAGALLCDADNSIVEEYSVYTDEKLELDSWYYYYYVELPRKAIPSYVPNGTYKLIMATTPSLTKKKWTFVHQENGKLAAFKLTVKSNSVIISEFEDDPDDDPLIPEPDEEEEEEEDIEGKDFIGQTEAKKIEEERMRFTWEAPDKAKKYVVNVIAADDESMVYSSDTVSSRRAEVQFYYPDKLKYSWILQALGSKNKLLQKTRGEDFVLEVLTDYAPQQLTYEVRNKDILFLWKGGAPMYELQLYRNGQLVWRQFIRQQQFIYTDRTAGEYEWKLRSMNNLGTIPISRTVIRNFTIKASQGIEDTNTTQTNIKYIHNGQLLIRQGEQTYDALGR